MDDCSGVDDRVLFASCTMAGLDTWEYRFDFGGADAPYDHILINVRHHEEPVESGALRIQWAQLSKDGVVSAFVDNFFDFSYSTLRHIRSEDFLLRLEHVDGVRYVLLDRPDLFEPPVSRMEIYDEEFVRLEEFETEVYAKERL